MKSETLVPKLDCLKAADKLWRVKVTQGRGLLKIVGEKGHGQSKELFLELNGSRTFEIGNDCNTCHFWFRRMQDPKFPKARKVVNLPKTLSLPRPLDDSIVQELAPIFDLLEKGDYHLFQTEIPLEGPYGSEDEKSYFYNDEFLESWEIGDPGEEGLVSGWEHYEGAKPRLFRHQEPRFMEKQFEFIIPLVPGKRLKEENVKLYQEMIRSGDRPRILLLGMLQRGLPRSFSKGQADVLHSYFAGFVLDGHHKLAAYRKCGIPATFLVIVSPKASKFVLAKGEVGASQAKLEERLSLMAL